MEKLMVTLVTVPEEMEKSSDVFEDTNEELPNSQPSTSSASQEHPQPGGQEPTPAAGELEIEPMVAAADPPEREPSNQPDGPVEINPTESFDSLYEVRRMLASASHGTVHEGIRRSDGTPVIIKFVKKRRFDFHIGQSKPFCREAALMWIMKHNDHVMELYDWFDVEDRNILAMEHPGTNMTLCDFVKENGGRLSEAEAKAVMQKIIAALRDCSVQGVYYKNISLKKVLINKDTMQIKLTGFYRALTINERHTAEFRSEAERKYHALMVANKGLNRVLKGMVKGKIWFRWRNTRLSRECKDLLGKLRDRESDITLQNIVDHDWFNTDALEDVREGRLRLAVVRAVRTLLRRVCLCGAAREPSEERPHTPGQEPTQSEADPVETTDLTLKYPRDLRTQNAYFLSLYEVLEKLENNGLVRKGVRRSDGKSAIIKFVTRSSCPKEIEKPVKAWEPMMELQKAPTCDQIIRVYDLFITEQRSILVTEYLPAFVTLDKFLERNKWLLSELTMKRIIRQIILVMRHSMDRGFFFDVYQKWILIDITTKQIKLVDFDVAFFARNEEDCALMRKRLYSTQIMRRLICLIRPSTGQQTELSAECRDFYQDLLRRKTRGCIRSCRYNLENVLDHPWFKDIAVKL